MSQTASTEDAFTPTARSRIKRLHERAAYDRDAVYAVLDAEMIAHVAYVIDGQPYVTPTAYWRDGDRLFWHGSSASRMLRTVKTGIPACFSVAMLDGLVLARSGFHSSINYRSVSAFGTAHAIEDPDEKLAALTAFSERLTPGQWDELRPATSQELKATTVVTMVIEEAVAKIRTGPPGDDDEDYALDIWAGVLPVTRQIEQPIDDPKLKAGVAQPDHLNGFKIG
ncbi:MAG: pyridoxamine 5'-phosphate oxidase family protein [Alphaproteobacteria bacterium]